MDSGEKLPLPWSRKRTPTRNQRRARNWQHLYIGGRIGNTRWTLVEGPWRVLKPSGSLSRVRVLCDPQYGGCGTEHVRHLGTIIQGRSSKCLKCHHQHLRDKARAAAEAGIDTGTDTDAGAEAGAGTEAETDAGE